MKYDENGLPVAGIAAFLADIYKDFPTEKECNKAPGFLPKYKELYEVNPDLTCREQEIPHLYRWWDEL